MVIVKLDKPQLIEKAKLSYGYLLFVWRRCQEDNIKVPAGHLAYVTLLSIVPF